MDLPRFLRFEMLTLKSKVRGKMQNRNSLSTWPQRQSGVSLIIALIFLVVLTLFATAGVRTTLLQERMAGNSIDMNLSFQAAELAVREAELKVGGGLATDSFTSACITGLCARSNAPYWADAATWVDGGAEKFARINVNNTAISNLDPPLAAVPKYIVELVGKVKAPGETNGEAVAFRVVAHAVGTNDKTETNLMTTYLVPPLD